MRSRTTLAAVAIVVALATPSCDGGGETAGPMCDAESLEAALAGAAPGDTVRIGACRISGSFTVPAGVTLAGEGAGASVLVTPGLQPALRLTPGTPGARATDLSVESSANSGVLIRGSGEATLEDASVTATRGMAVAVENIDSLTLTNVTLTGPITRENADGFAAAVTPDETATHGLVVAHAGAANLSNVTATGFADIAVLLVSSTTTWTGGGATDTLGIGVMVYGGTAVLADLDLSRTFQGIRLVPAYGAVFAAGAVVETTNLSVTGGANYGLLHDSASARHRDLRADDNHDAAVWVQFCPSFEMSGAATEVAGNRFAGVVVYESENVVVQDAHVDTSALAVGVFEETGSIQVGDGIQVVHPIGPTTFRNVTLAGNERVGLLVSLRGESSDLVTIEDVAVDGAGTQLGAVIQGGTVTPGWDAGITRTGATSANDAAFRGTLSTVGRIAPDDIPQVGDVDAEGLAGISNPDPPL